MAELTNISYVALALIGRGGASPQDLVDMQRRGGRIYYAVADSRLYAEPKRLERLGYVTSHVAPGKTREKTVYALTELGVEAMRLWALEPAAPARIQNEAIVKLMCGDIAGDDAALLDAVLAQRTELEAQAAKLAEAEGRLDALPHRARYLRLVIDLGRRIVEAQRAWLDEVETELGGMSGSSRGAGPAPRGRRNANR